MIVIENNSVVLIEKEDITDYNAENIKNLIYTIRGKQVMLDSDVAMLYHYTTKNINKAVKRNIDRFPEDFCFQLTEVEFQNLRFQFGTLNKKVNNGEVTRKYLPYAFTEQGIAKSNRFHDRFIVIDNKEIYHVGASLKDLGKKCFAISRIEDTEYINKLLECK